MSRVHGVMRWRGRAANLACAAVVPALLLTACGGSATGSSVGGGNGTAGSGTSSKVSIAFFSLAFANPYEQAHGNAIRQEAAKLGVTLRAFDGNNNASTQYSQMETAIASGQYQGFILDPEGSTVFPAITDAGNKGIKVFCALLVCGNDPASIQPQVKGQVGFAGVNEADTGRYQVDMMATICTGVNPCDVAYAEGGASVPTDEARTAALKAELKKYPNIKLVALVDGNYDRATSYKAAQDVFSAHPDIKVFAAGADQMMFGVAQAADEAHSKAELIGTAGSKEGVAQVCAKHWYGEPIDIPVTAGEATVDNLVKAIHGDQFQAVIDPRTIIGKPFVTQADACSFTAQWSAYGS